MTFKISKKYKNDNWNNLNLVEDSSENWVNGIAIIKDRFESRFFNQIKKIEKDVFSGFIIMSIDCLLIESLMQFYLGVDNTEINYRGNQWKAFKDFFQNSEHFKNEFRTNEICQTFYKQFRCGLLHQAQTKEKSLIKINQKELLTLVNPTIPNQGLIIDRKEFHNRLKLEFDEYIRKLTENENNFMGENLRMKAILKMNLICL